MAVEVGSLFASLTLESGPFTRGMAQAERTTATTLGSIQRHAGLTSRAVEGVQRQLSAPVRPYSLIAASRAFDNASDRANLLRGALIATTGVLGGFTAALTSNVILRYADTYTLLNNQIRVVSDSTGDLRAQFSALEDVAERSRSGLTSTAVLYSRLAKAAPDLDPSRILRYTETIQKALQLGGATAQEAASAAIQFSQAIASNRLGGEELRAVLETPLGGALAKGLGVSIGQLREMSVQGKLTAKVVLGALENIGGTVDQQFSQSVRTLDQAITQADNKFISYIGKVNEAYGVTNILGGAILGVADNLETLGSIAGTVAPIIAGIFAGRLIGGGIGRFQDRVVGGLRAVRQEARDTLQSASSDVTKFRGALGNTNTELSQLLTRLKSWAPDEFAERGTVKQLARDLNELSRLDQQRLGLNDDVRDSYRQLAQVTAQTSPRMISATEAVAKAEGRLNELLVRQEQLRRAARGASSRVTGASALQSQIGGGRQIEQVRAAAREQIQLEREITAAQQQAAAARTALSARFLTLTNLEAEAAKKAADVRVAALKKINALTAQAAAIDKERAALQSRVTSGVSRRDAEALANASRQVAVLRQQQVALQSALGGAEVRLSSAARAATLFGQGLAVASRVGSSFVSFLGGPWGVALAAATVALSAFGAKSAASAQQIADGQAAIQGALELKAPQSAAAEATLAQRRLNEEIADTAKKLEDVQAVLDDSSGAEKIALIAAEIDSLRELVNRDVFKFEPTAVRFFEELVEKIRTGRTSIAEFNRDIDDFAQAFNIDRGLADQIKAETAGFNEVALAAEVYRKKLEDLRRTKTENSRTEIFGGSERSLLRQAEAQAFVDAQVFADRVSQIKSKEQKIVDGLLEAIRKSGMDLNQGLVAYVEQVAKAQTALETLREFASRPAPTPPDLPRGNVRRVGDFDPNMRGLNNPFDQAKAAEQLRQMIDIGEKMRQVNAALAEGKKIASEGVNQSVVEQLFGDRANTEEVRASIQQIGEQVKRLFADFQSGAIKPAEAFKQLEEIRAKFEALGAGQGPLDAFLGNIQDALTGIPNLKAEIVNLTREMRALAVASQQVKLPGGSVVKSVPNGAEALPGFRTGGSFNVGGAGGADSKLVQFMASPNETVAVFTPSQMRAMNDNLNKQSMSQSVNAPINIYANDPASFRASRRQVQQDIADAVSAAVKRPY